MQFFRDKESEFKVQNGLVTLAGSEANSEKGLGIWSLMRLDSSPLTSITAFPLFLEVIGLTMF